MPVKCEWTEDIDYGIWYTGCELVYEFGDGGPVENGFRICPFCGDALEAIYYEPDEEALA